jgi:UrcA family protein
MNTVHLSIRTALALTLALAAVPAAHAFAGEAPADAHAASARVSYADLDLDQPRDVRRLYGRLRQAAREVCRHGAAPKTYAPACARAALAAAVASVRSPTLDHLHRESGD